MSTTTYLSEFYPFKESQITVFHFHFDKTIYENLKKKYPAVKTEIFTDTFFDTDDFDFFKAKNFYFSRKHLSGEMNYFQSGLQLKSLDKENFLLSTKNLKEKILIHTVRLVILQDNIFVDFCHWENTRHYALISVVPNSEIEEDLLFKLHPAPDKLSSAYSDKFSKDFDSKFPTCQDTFASWMANDSVRYLLSSIMSKNHVYDEGKCPFLDEIENLTIPEYSKYKNREVPFEKKELTPEEKEMFGFNNYK